MTSAKPKHVTRAVSGFCQLPGKDDHGHRHCQWGTGYETPSTIMMCLCECHENGQVVEQAAPRAIVPKGPVARKIVPKK